MNPPGITQHDPLIGTTIGGRYRIEARIGAGAMGAVYRAAQAGLGRAVALKLLKRDMAWGGDTVQRFRREAKAMSALHHPNTVRVFDFGATDNGLLFLAMELLEGEPVTEQLARTGALGMHEAVIYAQQVLRSIGEAHAQGIVHRDLKPDNIFVARVGGQPVPVVKVLDFGIAKAIEGDRKIDQFETLDGTVFGTPRYMSPEQAAGKTLDPRSDLYSVGILLYEFLTGDPPFVDADAVVVMAKHIREAPVPLRRSAPDRFIPPSLEAVVAKALEKDPSQRFQSADEFDRALSLCLPDVSRFERMSVAGVHKTPIGRLMLASARTRVLVGGLLAALVISGALGAWLSTRDRAAMRSAAISVTVPTSGTDTASVGGSGAAAPSPNSGTAKPEIVTLDSQPSGAEVSRDGAQIGTTPLDIVVPTGAMTSVSLHKLGFVDHTVELHADDHQRLIALNPLPPTTPSAAEPRPTKNARHTKPTRHSAARTPTEKKPTGPTSTSPYEKF